MLYAKETREIIEGIYRASPEAGEYNLVLETIAAFAEKELLPGAKAIDGRGVFPAENLKKVSDAGVMAMPFPADSGGLALPFPLYAAAVEILSSACANTALQVSIQGMVCEGIRAFGDVDRKRRFLKDGGLTAGKALASFALTEPCCGSDVRSIETRAVFKDGGYVIDGVKTLITSPGLTDYTMLFAKTDKGISTFIVPAKAPGFEVSRAIPKLGFKGHVLSEVRLAGLRVPEENLIGEEGEGFEHIKHVLNYGRVTIAAIAVGIAQAAFSKSIIYSKERKAFGKAISEFELTQEKLSDMATGINASRLLVFHAASLKEAGKDFALAASEAKLFSTETALKAADAAIQIHGGYGYTDEYDVHRHWRDARLLTIGEGTSEVLRLLIARLVLKG